MKKTVMLYTMIYLLTCFSITTIFLSRGYAADVRVLKGTVVTPQGTPASDRSLAISGLDAKLPSKIPIMTDNKGNFSVFNLPPGKYKIVPQSQPQIKGIEVEVTPKQVQKLDAPIELGR